jgi:hyperosmotically inducible periplasmic protein
MKLPGLITLATATTLAVLPMSVNATQANKNAAATQNRATSDSTLAERVEARLDADASLKKYDVDVSVQDGVATLTGTVRTAAEKARAERDVKIAGITRVDNRIAIDKDAGTGFVGGVKNTADTVGQKTKNTADTVGSKTKNAAETAGDKTKTAVETAGDKTRSGAETAGQKTKEGVNKSGEVITDAWITAKVHTRFTGEDALKGSDIDVDTNNHIVTLNGTVKSAAGRARAVELAKTTDGVTKVVDNLKIQ